MTIDSHRLVLSVLDGLFCVCRLPPNAGIPAWVPPTGWISITRTTEELSIVCAQKAVPADVRVENGYRMFKIEGPLDFALTGILAAVARPLADAGIAIFAVSTFDTDYLMVCAERLPAAVAALQAAGHVCRPAVIGDSARRGR